MSMAALHLWAADTIREAKENQVMTMIATLKDVLERAEAWPVEAQQELAEIALELEATIQAEPYMADAEELAAIDEAEQSGVASTAEAEAAFKAFRRA
jgi:hypothetical protein